MEDNVNHPKHYTEHPSGVECITIAEHMGFNLGNAIKYIWRADSKGNTLEDLKKAAWYLQREIEKRMKEPKLTACGRSGPYVVPTQGYGPPETIWDEDEAKKRWAELGKRKDD